MGFWGREFGVVVRFRTFGDVGYGRDSDVWRRGDERFWECGGGWVGADGGGWGGGAESAGGDVDGDAYECGYVVECGGDDGDAVAGDGRALCGAEGDAVGVDAGGWDEDYA